MKRYVLELRVREAGDVDAPGPVQSVVELPGKPVERVHFGTLGAAFQAAVNTVNEWMRSKGDQDGEQ